MTKNRFRVFGGITIYHILVLVSFGAMAGLYPEHVLGCILLAIIALLLGEIIHCASWAYQQIDSLTWRLNKSMDRVTTLTTTLGMYKKQADKLIRTNHQLASDLCKLTLKMDDEKETSGEETEEEKKAEETEGTTEETEEGE